MEQCQQYQSLTPLNTRLALRQIIDLQLAKSVLTVRLDARLERYIKKVVLGIVSTGDSIL